MKAYSHYLRVGSVFGQQTRRRRPIAALGDRDDQRGVEADERGEKLAPPGGQPPRWSSPSRRSHPARAQPLEPLGGSDHRAHVIRAILEAAQLPVEVHENVIRSGDDAVIVASHAEGSAADALTRAFLRFQKSGASQGVVVSLGYLDPRDVRRRRALAPNLHYADLSAIQRMADAVAVGADPLTFATEPGSDG